MMLFINGILYSLYCFENRFNLVLLCFFKPILFVLAKIIYACSFCKDRKYKSFECYRKEIYTFVKKSISDLDYGNSLSCSEFGLFLIIASYSSLLIIIIYRFSCLFFALKLSFNIYIGVVVVLSASIVHFSCFQNDEYKVYFKKFKSYKNNNKRHLNCLLLIIGAFFAVYLTIVLFKAEYFEF